MKLSTHFTLEDLTRSDYAIRHGIDNEPSAAALVNLSGLCVDVLEPLQAQVGPLTILSGYRCPVLNVAVGGALHSAHMYGLAADVVVAGLSLDALGQAVRKLALSAPLAQVIREYGSWIHVARRPLNDLGEDDVTSFLIKERDQPYARWV